MPARDLECLSNGFSCILLTATLGTHDYVPSRKAPNPRNTGLGMSAHQHLVLDLHGHLAEQSPVEESTFVDLYVLLLIPFFFVPVLTFRSEYRIVVVQIGAMTLMYLELPLNPCRRRLGLVVPRWRKLYR